MIITELDITIDRVYQITGVHNNK